MIGSSLRALAEATPHKIAIQTETEQITYHTFYKHVTAIQEQLLQTVGQGPGKRVALFLGNEPAFLEAFFAAALLGWAAIPIDPKWSQREREAILAECRPDAAVSRGPSGLSIKKLKDAAPAEAEENPIFYIGYTSGSTGRPKGFMRHHRSWLKSFSGGEQAFSISAEDVMYAPGPLCHSLSLFAAVHALHLGATLHIQTAFSAEAAAKTLQTEPITVMYAVPTMLYAIAQAYGDKQNPVLRSILCSGAKWPAEQKELLHAVFPNARRFEFYGASELSFITYIDEAGSLQKPDSVGIPFPEVELFILRADGTEADTGEVGELHVKSPLVFSGYVHGTEDVFRGEYATVGDLGFRDLDGYITLVGRKKNMIISGGLNIYPEEVEEVLRRHPDVAEAAVAGVQDDYWGEKLVAVIQWQGEPDPQALKAYCRQQLASYKCPRLFLATDRFPLTSSGKLARTELPALIAQKLQEELTL